MALLFIMRFYMARQFVCLYSLYCTTSELFFLRSCTIAPLECSTGGIVPVFMVRKPAPVLNLMGRLSDA